jgi:hypothetical protein
MKKTIGILLIVLALVIGIVPILTDCTAHGRSLTTDTSKSIHMKCHWTSLAEIGVAVPLALVGLFNITSKRKETLRIINVIGLALGVMTILFPTVLIGVCAKPDMPCRMIELPALVLSGILVIIASLVGLANSRSFIEPSGAV